MTPADEKAAPIPADVLALADATFEAMALVADDGLCVEILARAIMQYRVDRASQEERIREDERDRLLAAVQFESPFGPSFAIWLRSVGAMLPAERARQRGDAS